MRCFACNRALSDYESTRKSSTTGEFLDMCNKCVKSSGISYEDRPDLEDVFSSELEEENFIEYVDPSLLLDVIEGEE